MKWLFLVPAAVASAAASAAPTSAPSAPSPSPSATSTAQASTRGCVEKLPDGPGRPALTAQFPMHALSGHATILKVMVTHALGERVLPEGLRLDTESADAKEIERSHFAFPSADSPSQPVVTRGEEKGDRVTTTIELPLVPLPEKSGRSTLRIPRLPVTVARKNGEVWTLCTPEAVTTVEDPTASTPDAKPKPNPPPLVQREEWTLMRQIVQWGSVGLVAGGMLSYVAYRILTRPKPPPPPVPPRPPWELALEQLDEARHAGLLDQERFAEFVDRVNDAVRKYLGTRYGFDGLESTTDEIVRALSTASLLGITHPEVRAFLGESDLVKFAGQAASRDDCEKLLAHAEHIVRSTTPAPRTQASVAPPPHAPSTPSAPPPPPAPPPAPRSPYEPPEPPEPGNTGGSKS